MANIFYWYFLISIVLIFISVVSTLLRGKPLFVPPKGYENEKGLKKFVSFIIISILLVCIAPIWALIWVFLFVPGMIIALIQIIAIIQIASGKKDNNDSFHKNLPRM